MSEQWMGLHNPERHRPGVGACSVCETLCWGPQPCKCCLAAEVEALRAERDRFANQLVVRVAHWKDATND
jgi:hypothetical protein